MSLPEEDYLVSDEFYILFFITLGFNHILMENLHMQLYKNLPDAKLVLRYSIYTQLIDEMSSINRLVNHSGYICFC